MFFVSLPQMMDEGENLAYHGGNFRSSEECCGQIIYIGGEMAFVELLVCIIPVQYGIGTGKISSNLHRNLPSSRARTIEI